MFGFAGMFLLESGKLRKLTLATLLGALLLILCACGGGAPSVSSIASQAVTQGTYAITVSGTSNSLQNSTTLTLNIR